MNSQPKLPKSVLAAATVMALGALLTGCVGGGGGSAEQRTDVNVVVPAQPANLDPHLSTLQITSEVVRPIYDSLIAIDADWNIRPVLAESYERSEDGLNYTFYLRDGVKFHDGSDLDASDVVASMERWVRTTTVGQNVFVGAEWVEIDPLTVELRVPQASFLYEVQLSSRLSNWAAIMPAAIAQAAGDDPVTDIVGTGPYEFVEWQSDQYLTIKKWNDYQPAAGPASGMVGDRTGTVESVTFNFVADPATRTLALQSGQYDIATEVPYDNLTQIYEDPNLEVGAYLVTPQQLIYSDQKSGPSQRVEFRQAINIAVDRDPIMMAAVGGDPELYDLVHHQMGRDQEQLWNTEVGKAEFNRPDVQQAKELLQQAGYRGEEVTLIVTRDYTEAYNSAVVLVEQLKEIGVTVNLETMEWGAYIDRFLNDIGSWDLTVLPNTLMTNPGDTIGFVEGEPGYFGSERLSALMAEYLVIATIEEAQEFYDEMQQYVEEVRPLTKLGDVANVYAATTALEVPVFDSTIGWWQVQWKH